MNDEAYCTVCSNEKQVATGCYRMIEAGSGWMCDGKFKSCPGCDGTSISVRAKVWRKDNDWKGA